LIEIELIEIKKLWENSHSVILIGAYALNPSLQPYFCQEQLVMLKVSLILSSSLTPAFTLNMRFLPLYFVNGKYFIPRLRDYQVN